MTVPKPAPPKPTSCPTPDKLVFSSEADGYAYLLQEHGLHNQQGRNNFKAARVYRCGCMRYHLSSKVK